MKVISYELALPRISFKNGLFLKALTWEVIIIDVVLSHKKEYYY